MKKQVSHPIVVLQHISTIWSKASRGGENATLRNRTPEALPLPDISHLSFDSKSMLLQQVIYSERNKFETPVKEQLEIKDLAEPFRYECLVLSRVEEMLQVTLEWERKAGAPRRAPFPRKAFQLQDHQWGRVEYNLRISGEDCWIYTKHVFNIATGAPLASEVFLQTEPAHTYSDIASLW